MANLEKLKETLAAEAEAQAAEVLAEGERRAAAVRAEAEARAEQVGEEVLAAVRREVEVRRRQAAAEERLLRRQLLLAAKAALVEEALAAAQERLAALPDEEYRAFMVRLIGEEALSGRVTVRLNERDRSRLGEDFLRELAARLAAAGRAVELRLDPVPAPIAGGALVVGEGFELDCSVERLLDDAADALEPEVAQVLFG